MCYLRKRAFNMAYVYSAKLNKKLPFYSSIVDHFSSEDEIQISLKQNAENIHIDSPDEDAVKLPLKRPSFCPFHLLSTSPYAHLSNNQELSLPVAAAVLFESTHPDGGILLTRRAAHMRSFPTVWVPPGGHVDPGETLQDTAFRELAEETGLHYNHSTATIRPLCAWESAYPTMLSLGAPKKHHLVLYYLVRPLSNSGPEPRVKVDPGEVDAYCWLDRDAAGAIASSYRELDYVSETAGPQSIRCFMLSTEDNVDKGGVWMDRPFSLLTNTVSGPLDHANERVSTGTKYALYKWLQTDT